MLRTCSWRLAFGKRGPGANARNGVQVHSTSFLEYTGEIDLHMYLQPFLEVYLCCLARETMGVLMRSGSSFGGFTIVLRIYQAIPLLGVSTSSSMDIHSGR